jgi:hypothetical protein
MSKGLGWHSACLAASLVLLLGGCAEKPGELAATGGDGHEDHAAHAGHGDHSAHAGHGTERDAEGRRLYGMAHQMPPELYDELRQKVALYRNYTNAEIDLSMEMMGAEYQWYISPPELQGEQGVIVLLHGFREHGDRVFRQQVQPMANIFPTSLAIGMSMMMSDHVQLSIDDLEDLGVKKIVVLPVVSSSDNEMYRQWRYIFGYQDEAEYATVPRVQAKSAEIIFAIPPEDDPLVAEILLDHALEISEDSSREAVFIVSHGPTSSSDNQIVLQMLDRLGRMVREDGGFAEVTGMTLQDDAPPEVRAGNVELLRAEVARVQAAGRDVLVVTNLIGSRTIQAKLRSDLAGFEYRFNPKGIVQHDNFTKWMNETLREALSSKPGATT